MAVSTITYSNKTDLNTTATADINKVKATDLNEVKTVVNNNATELSKLQGTILWTNPSPTSTFNAQTITLSSNDYDVLEIYFAIDNSSANNVANVKTIKGRNAVMSCLAPTATVSPLRVRKINYSTDISLNVETAYYGTNSLSSTNNNYVIPLYVVGYKTGLF